jgi:hypothetical protein
MTTSKLEYDVGKTQMKLATIPHDIMLLNLIGNHILVQVGVGSVANIYPLLLLIIPVISFSLIWYTIWRAGKSPEWDTPFIQCHWSVAAKRAKVFLMMLGVLAIATIFAAIAHFYMGMMQEFAIALVIGVGLLPVMVTMFVLIMMESDALHMAKFRMAPSCPNILGQKDAIQPATDNLAEAV